MKLAGYCGKIRRIMLHKLQIAGQSTRFAPITCDTRAFAAMTSCTHYVPFGVLFDSRWVCEASYGSKIGFFEPYCGNSGALLQWIIEKVLDNQLASGPTTHCHDMLHKSYSLPTDATDQFVACLLQTGF